MKTFTTNVQWKGTDLCMDFICPSCGSNSHFDGMFAHNIQCPHCEDIFEMPTDLLIKKVATAPDLLILKGEK